MLEIIVRYICLKVLIIEDFIFFRRSLKVGLLNLGFIIDDIGDGFEGLSMVLFGDYLFLIFDLMFFFVDGMLIFKVIR